MQHLKCGHNETSRWSPPTRRRGLKLNMAFNLGVDGLLKFKNTLALLRSAIEGHASYARVADGMLNSLWAKQVGRRADELARQMRTGEYI